jgi:protein-S-isoprenylcysteine O-methyltransferase Ste14
MSAILKLGAFLFRNRDYTPIPIVIAAVVFARADLASLAIGTAMILIGESIRLIGVAHIGGISRTKSYSTGKRLITSGLFAHVRNPLYIGNLFLSTGLVVTANVGPVFVIGFVLFFFLQYIPIVLWEESNLRRVFGTEFDAYAAKVPRWIPALQPRTRSDEKTRGSYGSALKSERNTLVAAVMLYLLILIRSYIDIHRFFT